MASTGSSMHSLTYLLAFLATGVVGANTNSAVAVCCDKLREAYPDQVVSASDASYTLWNERWADTAELLPSCIFRPLAAEDVSFAVQTLADGDGSGSGACPFSIKSGGHTPWAGANNVKCGVAITLDWMNQTVISEDRSYISLGAGTIWHDAYANTDGEGVAFLGGRCPGTGVGGLTVGGGYSWFTGEHGFVADTVINYEIVLASGEIVNANADNNADLFRALKGGNNNFGVVTRFDLETIPHSQQVYGGLVIVPANASSSVLDHLYSFTDDSTGVHASEGLQVEFFMDPATGDGQILLWLIDTNAEGSHSALQPFFEMEPKILNQVYQTSIADYPTNIPPVSRVLMADATFVNDPATIKGVYKITIAMMKLLEHIPNMTWDFQFEVLSRHIQEASNAKGGNVMGFSEPTDDLIIVFVMPLWEDSAYDETVNKVSELWYRLVQLYTKIVGKGHPYEFANYAAGFQNPMASYGADNLRFLQEVATTYDPTSLFQTAVKGGYKLNLERNVARSQDFDSFGFDLSVLDLPEELNVELNN